MQTRITNKLFAIATWAIGLLLPIFLVVTRRRAYAVLVLASWAMLLLVGLRWRPFLRWAIGGMTGGVALGLFLGWLFAYNGRTPEDDQAAVIFILTVPVGVSIGLIVAGLAFRRWDPRAPR